MRIGPTNQTGSDSLLTAATFFKIRELYFNDQEVDDEYNGKLYGLGQTALAALAAASSSTNGHLDGAGMLSAMGMGMGMGMGVGSMSTMSLRSGATIAERERTPLPRDTNGNGGSNGVSSHAHSHSQQSQNQQQQSAQQQQQQSQSQQQQQQHSGMLSQAQIATPVGLGGPFASALGTPYGAMPNGAYVRQMAVGGDR